MTDEPYSRVDLGDTVDLLRKALEEAEELHGTRMPKEASQRRTALSNAGKRLLLLAHMLDKGRVEVLDEYHLSRGFTAHMPEQET